MKRSAIARVLPAFLIAAAVMSPLSMFARAGEPGTNPSPMVMTDRAEKLWLGAKEGDWERVLGAMMDLPQVEPSNGSTSLRGDLDTLRTSIAKRETMRAARIAKVTGLLDESLAAAQTPAKISECLKHAVELHELAPDAAAKAAVLSSDKVKQTITRADAAARQSEGAGDWLMAAELFGRLNILLDIDQTYKHDARRMGDRLSMLRLYAPKRLWELRNERREQDRKTDPKLGALAPFNSVGESFQTKLKDISATMLNKSLSMAANYHVEQVGMRKLVIGGLQAVRTLVSTPDLRSAFPELDNPRSREAMLSFINEKIEEYKKLDNNPGDFQVASLIDEILKANAVSVKVMPNAIMHEFGNGAFDQLDEFSTIIWPDEYARFNRMVESSFVGVGIQIQADEDTQKIKVIMPLDNTPAFRAGIKPGDYISKINDDSAVGMTVDQAVDLITGKQNSKVRITIDRAGEEIPFELARKKIPIVTVKGWQRLGNGDSNWDFMIDAPSKTGYIRLTQFNETTTDELHKALAQLKAQGMQNLILDLRFNPGGLLNEAVSVASTFVNAGEIVWTQKADGSRVDTHSADADKTLLKDISTVVLVNNGSASASEIVSGALKYYADQNKIKALVIGNRTYGKGSVQNVAGLNALSKLKLTTQYYFLPGGQIIHRREHATRWGVDPHLNVDMLPQQVADALSLRQDADLPADAKPVVRKTTKDDDEMMYKPDPANFPPNPARLITQGIDLQLETAVFILKAQSQAKKDIIAGGGKGEKNPG